MNMKAKNKNLTKISERSDTDGDISVSVIVDTFNHEKYISEALESILSQKVDFNVEILVHDDCSKDGTTEIIKKYAKKYPSIVKPLFEKENQFSKGIEIDATFNYPRIKGKYVAMLEGDDVWIDDNKLFKQFNFLEKHTKISAYIAKTIRFNMRDNKFGYYGMAKGCFSRYFTLKDLINGKDFSVSSILARKEFFMPPFPEFLNFFAGFTDIQLGFYFALRNKIYYDCKPMSMYRQYSGPNSFTSTFSLLSNEKKLKTYRNRITVLELLQKECPKKYLANLKKRIKSEKFSILILKKDEIALKSKEYRMLYYKRKWYNAIKKILHLK